MAVHILAFTIVIIKNVSSLESENFGYPNHSAKIIKIHVKNKLAAFLQMRTFVIKHNVMKKTIFILSLLSSAYFYSQDFSGINKILDKIESKNKKIKDASDYDLKGKKFVMVEEFDDHSERHILEMNADGTLTLIELIDDKATGKSFSNIFTGDFVRKKNAVSVRANFLEGQKIAMPLIYNLYIMNADNIWYLKDINNSKRWIENNNLIKKKK
jgi:hypothetical protein